MSGTYAFKVIQCIFHIKLLRSVLLTFLTPFFGNLKNLMQTKKVDNVVKVIVKMLTYQSTPINLHCRNKQLETKPSGKNILTQDIMQAHWSCIIYLYSMLCNASICDSMLYIKSYMKPIQIIPQVDHLLCMDI